jgi:hypothetical protein
MTQASTMATVNVIMAGPVGIQPLEEQVLSLFPNPADTRLVIRWKNATDLSDCSVQVYDIMGQSIHVPVSWKEDETELSVASLSPGMYFLALHTPQGSRTMRFIRK